MAKIPFDRFGGPGGNDFMAAALREENARKNGTLRCPECGDEVWDGPKGHKLAKCWNDEGHASGRPLAFDTMTDDEPA